MAAPLPGVPGMPAPAVPLPAPAAPGAKPGPVQSAYNAVKNAPGEAVRRTDNGFTQVAKDFDNSSGWNTAAKIFSPAYGLFSTQRSFYNGFFSK